MKFYEVDGALQQAIAAGDKTVRVKIEIQAGGSFMAVNEDDIIEARFWGLKEAAGGVSSRGEVVFRSEGLGVRSEEIQPGAEVRVSFSLGEGLVYFQRFVFYLDEKGIQDIRGPGRKRLYRLGLLDLSYKLRKTDESRDWTSPAVFAYSVICDKSQPEKSLVHGIAQRAGLGGSDIDCSTIPVTLPYVKLKRNIWAELSSLALAYRCHLETAPEKPLVFAHSPYQSEAAADDEISHTFTGDDIFYFSIKQREDLYRNTVRLKINMPLSLSKREIWRYDDPPVFYDDFLQAYFPFRYPISRKIESGNYEAQYSITDANGKEQKVIYADQVDTQEEAENRLDYDGGPFAYSQYDVTTNHDKAILTLTKDNDGDLYHASIHGRPIALDLNRSCYMRDLGEIERHGTKALNVSGSYFSDDPVYGTNGVYPHYEDWVTRELTERIQRRREFVVKTHRAMFHARVGAKVRLVSRKEEVGGVISAFSFRYKRDKAFVAAFRILEGGTNE